MFDYKIKLLFEVVNKKGVRRGMKPYITIICISFLLISCRDRDYSVFEFPVENHGKFPDKVQTGQYSAFYGYQQVESYAKSLDKNIELVKVSSSQNVNIDGSSPSWEYIFFSAGKMFFYFFEYNGNVIQLTKTSESGIFTPRIPIIRGTWVNSNIALNTAEKNGGKTFRRDYPGCQISAMLFESLIPTWFITYSSPTEALYITINAFTGEFVAGSIGADSSASSVSTDVGNLKYTLSIPKTVFGVHDTLRASMTAMNMGAAPETLYVNCGNMKWVLINGSGRTIMSGPRFISNHLGMEILASNQSALVGLISSPIADSSGNQVQAGPYSLITDYSLKLNLMIQ